MDTNTPLDKMEVKQETDSSSSDMDKQTLLAVLQFLKKNNLSGTEELLRKEAQLSDDVTIEDSKESEDGFYNRALEAYKSDGKPEFYSEHYDSLKKFIESSLDVHKCELSMILYPVFVQMYLQLVYNDHSDTAQIFFEKYVNDQESYYQDDLNQLKTVTKKCHMKGVQLLESFQSSKFVLKMSRDSYNKLKRHLQENKKTILLNIIHEHMFIDVFDGAPRSKTQIAATAGAMCGESSRDASKIKIYHGLLKEPELNISLEDEEDIQEAEDKPKKKKPKKDPTLNKKSKNDPNSPALTRIPLPEMRDQDKIDRARAIKECSKRVAVAPDQPPSVLFYTFMNSYQGATCANISEDSGLLSIGFQNSQIRVSTLTTQRLRGMRSSNELEIIDKEADDILERMMDDRTASVNKILHGHSGPVYATSFNRDKSSLLSSSEDGTVRLWNLQTWSGLVCYKGHNYPVWDCKFSPYGYYFASCGMDRTARLWSTDHHQPIRVFAGHFADVDSVEFHPNTNYIATGSTDRSIRLWDVLHGACCRILTGHKGPIHSLCFSPCGRYLASGSTDKSVFIWDLQIGEQIAELRGHQHTVYSLAFSRDGATLSSGGLDCTVRLWDISMVIDHHDQRGSDQASSNSDGVSIYQYGCYYSKSSPIQHLHFTRKNLLIGCGPFVPS